jgi:integrase
MSSGSIQQRGPNSWRIRYDADGSTEANRIVRSETVRGTKKDAEARLTELLNQRNTGIGTASSKLTIAQHLRDWLDNDRKLSPKTRERYRQLAEQQIIPHLGAARLQALQRRDVERWHTQLLDGGGANGRPLAARTVGHAHRVLRRALEIAVPDMLARNVASLVKPPKVEAEEVKILTQAESSAVLERLEGNALHPIAATALATGMRRGEILALAWESIYLDRAVIHVRRSLEETKEGLRFKATKTNAGLRSLSIPGHLVEVLRNHLRGQLELRMRLGMGRPLPSDLVFGRHTGEPYPPDDLSRDWRRTVRRLGLPTVSFHALRHTHVSALIATKTDIVAISKRLGHASAAFTLRTYAHLFEPSDKAIAAALDTLFRGV